MKNRDLAVSETEHYKMYKAKKRFVFAGLLTSSVLAGSILAGQNVHADTVDTTNSNATQNVVTNNAKASALSSDAVQIGTQVATPTNTYSQTSQSTETMQASATSSAEAVANEAHANQDSASAANSATAAQQSANSVAQARLARLYGASFAAQPADNNQVVSQNFNFVDASNNQIVNTQQVSGVVDSQVPVHLQIPANWRLMNGETLPQETVLRQNPSDVNIKIQHVINTTTDTKEVERVINILNPITKHNDTQTQKVQFSRDKHTDMVTGEVTYGSWDHAGSYVFPAVDIQHIAGYTPSQENVKPVTVTPDSENSVVNVNYTVNEEGQVINLVDDNGNVIATTTVTGNAGTTQPVNLSIPKGWILSQGQSIPRNVVMTDNMSPINVTIQHSTTPINEQKDMIRTIIVTNPDGKETRVEQKLHFTRQNIRDNATNDITYGKWQGQDRTYPEFDVPAIKGYTASEQVIGKRTIDPEIDHSYTVSVIYNANSSDQTIDYIDDTTGQMLSVDKVTGKTGEKKSLNYTIPKGYKLSAGQNLPAEVTFTGDNLKPIAVHMEHIITDIPEESTVTRTITVNTPNAKPNVITQTANFKRTNHKDEVTGKITNGEWDKQSQQLDAYSAPEVDGYKTMPSTVPVVTVHPGDKNLTANVVYNPIDYHVTVKTIDKNTGNTLATKKLTGHIGQTIDINYDIPENYELMPYQNVPINVTFGDHDLDDVVIYLQHKTEPAKETKQIVRTINIHNPVSNKIDSTQHQTATFTRTNTKDMVTGKIVKNGEWSGEVTLPAFEGPKFDGYVQNKIDAWKVTANDSDQTVDLTYSKAPVDVQVTYKDKSGKTIGSQTISGTPDTTGTFAPKVPDGYQLVAGQDDKLKVDYGKTKDITLTVEPKASTSDSSKDSSKTDDGAKSDDSSKSKTDDSKQPTDTTKNDGNKSTTDATKTDSTESDKASDKQTAKNNNDSKDVKTDSTTKNQTNDAINNAVTPSANIVTPNSSSTVASPIDTTNTGSINNSAQESTPTTQKFNTVAGSSVNAQGTANSTTKKLPQTGNAKDASAAFGLGLIAMLGAAELANEGLKKKEN